MIICGIYTPKEIPPDIPDNEDFGIEYRVKIILPNGQTFITETEWLWEKEWNCIYNVIAWQKINKIIPFKNKNI